MQILNWIVRLFSNPNTNGGLDRFIESKAPQNEAEVDHWIRVYTKNDHNGWAL
jgi:hypothetical protein